MYMYRHDTADGQHHRYLIFIYPEEVSGLPAHPITCSPLSTRVLSFPFAVRFCTREGKKFVPCNPHSYLSDEFPPHQCQPRLTSSCIIIISTCRYRRSNHPDVHTCRYEQNTGDTLAVARNSLAAVRRRKVSPCLSIQPDMLMWVRVICICCVSGRENVISVADKV